MLVLTRKPGQLVLISPKAAMPPGLSMAEVFEEGPLMVVVRRVDRGSVSLGIEAPRWLYIERAERGNR
jgi:sRNA-binding carbon storage regulator CsrA